MRYAVYDLASGLIVQVLSGFPLAEIEVPDGKALLEAPNGVDDSTHYVADGQLVAFPPRPSRRHTWDSVALGWIDPRTLPQAQDARWAVIRAKRDELEASGFPYLGKVFDSDSRSVQRISVAVQAAQAAAAAGQPFSLEWTTADDSSITLDAAGMVGVPVALALYGDSLHQTARALRTAIYAVQPGPNAITELESITWPT